MKSRSSIDLSVVIPALGEGANLEILLPWLVDELKQLAISYEILVVAKESDSLTVQAAQDAGGQVLVQELPGYGGAILAGFGGAKGQYILTMDADLSHRPEFIHKMWSARTSAEITIASRYVRGGTAAMPISRKVLSRVLNRSLRSLIAMPIHDLSSGFRLYLASAIQGQTFTGRDFDLLEEILIRAYCEGWTVQEIPFDYHPRQHGRSTAAVLRVGKSYAKAFGPLWKLRNSILAADYDDRAHDSPIPLQRYWQRSRYRLATELIANQGPVLDVGCGSSRIMGALPPGSVALDILVRKLRYARKFSIPLLHASGFALPFPDNSFPCVLSSQVIEHVPKDSPMLAELCRVLSPGGRLILGTPDYSRKEWVYTEKLYGKFAPGAYADEHIAHYTREELINRFEAMGWTHEATRYILRGEMILALRKPAA